MTTYAYSPRASNNWPHVEPFVTSCLEQVEGRTAYSKKELAAALGPLAIWAWTRGSASPAPSEMLNRDVIEMYVSTGLAGWTKASRNTLRSRLLRLSEILAPDQPRYPLRRYGHADVSAPYTLREQAAFLSWARSQGTELRRENAGRLLGLGFGAGLSNEELIRVRADDVRAQGDTLTVRVTGDRPRLVPVLSAWTEPLERVMALPSDTWAFLPGRNYRSANLTGLFVAKSNNPPELMVRRMRATWIIHHLNRGTPTMPLLRAAGLQTIEPLDRYLRHVHEPTAEELQDAMR